MVVRRRAKARRAVPAGAMVELAHGEDFFHDGTGMDREQLEDLWRNNAALRQEVYDYMRDHQGGRPPWAELEFDKVDD